MRSPGQALREVARLLEATEHLRQAPRERARRVALSAPREFSRLLLDRVRDREGDLVLLDARVVKLVVEERGRLRFEKDPGSRSSSSSPGRSATLSWRFICAPACSATIRRPLVPETSSEDENDGLHGLNRVVGECEQRAHLAAEAGSGWVRSAGLRGRVSCGR
jgi:hypothetical protein